MVRLARGAARGHRGKMGRGRGLGPPPPLMARNNVMPPPIPPPHMPPPRMRPLPPPGMRSPPFAPPIPGPLPPRPPPHMRPPHPRLPPVPPVPPLRRNLPFHPRPPGPMFPPHGPIPRMPPPILPPLMRGRGRLPPRGMGLRHSLRIKKLGVAPFKQRRGKKNKNVKDKPEGDFFCTTCDRGFKTEEKLEEHCSEHVTCNIDGCAITAHKKIIEKHILLVHESGLFRKIGNKNSPEDIAQWIAERKRNYPTKKNIEEKVAQVDEMERRGERIHTDKSRFVNQSKGKGDKFMKNRNQLNRSNKSESQKSSSNKRNRQRPNKLNLFSGDTEQQDSWIGSLPHFPGTDLFPEEEKEDNDTSVNVNEKGFSDDEWENDTNTMAVQEEVLNTKNKPLAAVLNALCTAYDSDVESEDEVVQGEDLNLKPRAPIGNPVGEEDLKKSVITTGLPEIKDINSDKNDESGPEEVPILRQDISLPNSNNLNVTNGCDKAVNKENDELEETVKKGRKRKRSHNKKSDPGEDATSSVKKPFSQQPRKFVPRRRLTLLQKLLEPEMRHERNVILQCIRYIVANNFFGNGQ